MLTRFYSRFDMSRQETVIIEFILKGMKSHEIARRLSISTGTVKNHLYNIYRKAGVDSRTKLIQIVRQHVECGNLSQLTIK
jgi:DNA-binding NarL/FixJ family response regulator